MNSDGLVNKVEINTPGGISFSLLLASPVTRCMAYTVDIFCILLIWNIASILIRISSVISADIAQAFVYIFLFVIMICYGMILEWWWNGQTLGKRLFRLRVVDAEGLRLTPVQIVIRNLLRAVDSLPFFYMVGGLACLASKRYQRLGDYAARTYVIREKKVREPDISQVMPDKYNSFRDYPYLAARTRSRIIPAEADMLLKALLRRNSLSPEIRTEIYSKLALFIKDKVEFPQEATDGISDERYLKNILDILYRRRS